MRNIAIGNHCILYAGFHIGYTFQYTDAFTLFVRNL